MSRSDSVPGLNEYAEKLVAGEQIHAHTDEIKRTYPDGTVEHITPEVIYASNVKCDFSGETFSGYDTYKLRKFTLADGAVLLEKVYRQYDSSGPVIFLALQNESGNWAEGSQWSEDEMAQYT